MTAEKTTADFAFPKTPNSESSTAILKSKRAIHHSAQESQNGKRRTYVFIDNPWDMPGIK